MSNIRQSKEERVIARRDVETPGNMFTLFVYVEAPESFNGRVMRKEDFFRIDQGTDFREPGGGITIGNLTRAKQLHAALGEVIEEYERTRP